MEVLPFVLKPDFEARLLSLSLGPLSPGHSSLDGETCRYWRYATAAGCLLGRWLLDFQWGGAWPLCAPPGEVLMLGPFPGAVSGFRRTLGSAHHGAGWPDRGLCLCGWGSVPPASPGFRLQSLLSESLCPSHSAACQVEHARAAPNIRDFLSLPSPPPHPQERLPKSNLCKGQGSSGWPTATHCRGTALLRHQLLLLVF